MSAYHTSFGIMIRYEAKIILTPTAMPFRTTYRIISAFHFQFSYLC
ncbi:unnamed protein product [Callosobruchus maculatus]|uniref:Uncharacterized protein n=1 Tax=Callosobruchus maculatus TaxID=64391 RepID=A0A653DH42_CALMS|nr:unnamed protein product [Callosobruchus maculatus]